MNKTDAGRDYEKSPGPTGIDFSKLILLVSMQSPKIDHLKNHLNTSALPERSELMAFDLLNTVLSSTLICLEGEWQSLFIFHP